MTRVMKINSARDAARAFLIFICISLQGSFEQEGMQCTFDLNRVIEQSLPAGTELVSFPVRKCHQSQDTIVRSGILSLKKDAIATVLICHGFMCDKFDVSFLRTLFPKCNVLTFDFRAHGQGHENQYCTLGKEEALDIMGAVQYLRSRTEIQGMPLIAYGFSMGAASLIEAQSQAQLFQGLILDCPFDSSDALLRRGLEHLKLSFFGYEFSIPGKSLLEQCAYHPYVQSFVKQVLKAVSKFNATQVATNFTPVHPVESVEKISAPCFFITCKNDEKVPMEAVMAVYAGAQGYKRLWITNGRRHFDSFFYNPEAYTGKVHAFVDQVVSARFDDTPEKIVMDAPL